MLLSLPCVLFNRTKHGYGFFNLLSKKVFLITPEENFLDVLTETKSLGLDFEKIGDM